MLETQLRKRVEQVKERVSDSTDVFQELVAVKRHLADRMAECQAALRTIQASVSTIPASDPQAPARIQVPPHPLWSPSHSHDNSFFVLCHIKFK